MERTPSRTKCMHSIRPNAERARLAIVFFIVQLVVLMITIVTDVYQYIIVKGYEAGTVSMEELSRSDTVVSISGLLFIAALIASIIAFLRWFRRAYWNLHVLHPMVPRWSEGWAAGAWFVPFLNLWRPFQIMKEIWTGMHGAAPMHSSRAENTAPLGIWWASWLVSGFVTNAGTRIRMRADTLSDFLIAIPLDIVGSAISVVSLLLLLQIIRRVAAAEKDAYDNAAAPSDSIFAPGFNSIAPQQPPADIQ